MSTTSAGTSRSDSLSGTSDDDGIAAGSGNDTVLAGAGADTILGENGNDILDGGDGNDLLDGGRNEDRLQGGAGFDTLIGGANQDALFGDGDGDLLDGGDNADSLHGGGGADTLIGGQGDDRIWGSDGRDRILGGAGADTIDGGDGVDEAIFAGPISRYEITLNDDGSVIVRDLGGDSGNEGSDLLIKVERLRFANQTFYVVANAAPLADADTAALSEDWPDPVTGNLLAGDADPDGDPLRVASVSFGGGPAVPPGEVQGTCGRLTFSADGGYSYELTADLGFLAGGEIRTDTFTYTVVDGEGGSATQTLTVTITGVNDAALIGDPTASSVTEDLGADAFGNLVASGVIAISDPDAGEAFFITTVVPEAGNLGSLILAADGSYTYAVANTAVQYLGAGETKVERFTVEALDGTTKVVSFTIAGVAEAIANPVVDLRAVAAGTGGFKVIGERTADRAGSSIASVGDLNGDGLAELLIGAYWNDPLGRADAGAAYVAWGKADGAQLDLDLVAIGTGGFKILGETAGDEAGWSIAAVGDLNGDGLAELLIGAPNGDPSGRTDAGAAYLVWGKADGAAVDLGAVAAGTGGFRILGGNAGDRAGVSVASIGDLNGDGLAELLIGARSTSPLNQTGAGAAYVVWGKPDGAAVDLGAVALGTGGFMVFGERAGDNAGWSVSSIGDLNGDGLSELLVGAITNDPDGQTNAGAAYVVWGKQDGAAVNLDDVAAGIGGFKIKGETVGDQAAYSVSSIGDLNGDGRDELLVGAAFHDPDGQVNAGAAYVVWGKPDGTAVNLDEVAAGIGGFKILGEAGANRAGWSISAVGDLNGDNLPEILVGAVANAALGRTDAGAAYVVWGKADGVEVNLVDVAAGIGGFKVSGEDAFDNAAWSVSAIGDLNGDGRDELLVGAVLSDQRDEQQTEGDAGAGYVVFSDALWLGSG